MLAAVPCMALQLSEKSKISLITCSPGEELYARYGHTALLVYDPELHVQWVFNYGMFDFNVEDFYLKFVKGETWYELGVEDYQQFLIAYSYEKRQVYEQELNLSLAQRQAVLDAYRRSGLTVKDIDVFDTHDCFTSSEYAAISAFGITEPGKEYEAVENGIIAFNGFKPINPSGGLIGCGHPVGASGARMFLDCYKQVANQAGMYQIKSAKNAMMLNIGGSATTNYVFVIGEE